MLYHEVESVGPEVHFLVHDEDRHAKHFSDDLASLVGTTASMIIAKLNNDFAISPYAVAVILRYRCRSISNARLC